MLLTASDGASTLTGPHAAESWWGPGTATRSSRSPAPDSDCVPLLGRDPIVSHALEAVGPGNFGAVIAGGAGAGKTFLLEHLGHELEHRMYTVHVRGSSIGARTEYGALRFLLDAAGADGLNHPVAVFQTLARLLRGRSNGRPVVLLVDNAHLLDELAAATIGLLVRSGTARAVLSCTAVTGLAADLAGLWKDGILSLQTLHPFTHGQTEEWLASALGAPISRQAVNALWEDSGGNPLILKTVLTQYWEAGLLVERQGKYVLASASAPQGRMSSAIVEARLGALPVEQRNLLDLLALSGGMTPEHLRGTALPEDIQALMERGLACYSPARAAIHVSNPSVENFIRQDVQPGRSAQLRRRMQRAAGSCAQAPECPDLDARWQLMSGGVLTPEVTYTGAREANRRGDPHFALMLLERDPDRRLHHRAVLAEADALFALHRQPEAEELLQSFRDHYLDKLPLQCAAEFLLESALHSCILNATPAGAESYLRELRRRLDSSNRLSPATLRTIEDQLALAEATVRAYRGHYELCIQSVTDLYVNGRDEDLQLRAGALLSEALAMIGRQDDAVCVAEEVSERIRFSQLTDYVRAEASVRFLTVYLNAGMWDRCATVLHPVRGRENKAGVWPQGFAQLVPGLIHAHAGRAAQALSVLEPAIIQLHVLQNWASLAVALAAAAYAHSLQGAVPESQSYLRELESLPDIHCYFYKSQINYFAAQARSTNSGADICQELLRLAGDEEASGRTSGEMFLLCASVQGGDVTASPRLLSVARRCQGALAEACRLLATGLMAENPELILAAGELAQSFGHQRFCREAALTAHEVAVKSSNRTTARRALNVATESDRKIHGYSTPEAALARLDVLTSRERDIVQRVAAGASNKDIAMQLHISVRTVEGHLYQSYTKLQISGRDLLNQVHHDAARASGDE